MKKLSRREFLGKSTLGIGSAALLTQFPGITKANVPPRKGKLPTGFQVWTVREMLIRDFPGTLKMMADLGYESVEMCSPPGYESSGFGPLMKLKPKEMKNIINDAGLIFESSHYNIDEFRNNLDERIAFAVESGQKQMILSSFRMPEKATLSDWQKAADELNKFGERSRKAGIQMGFHNHHGEFATIDGTLIYDALIKQLDPDYVMMQFQVAVINIGFKASDYFRKYPGRFISAHLADWSSEEKKEVPVGNGIVDWKEFFSATETGGIKNIYVEMGMTTFKESAEFLNSI